MLIRLSHTQAHAVMLRVSEPYVEAMTSHRTKYGRTQHTYDLPSIAWRKILDAMIACCYGPVGGKLKDKGRPSDSAYKAISRIAEGVKRIENHPALRGASVEGWVGDVVPAWGPLTSWEERSWSCYPNRVEIEQTATALDVHGILAWPFRLLVPQHVENLGMKITRWGPIEVSSTYDGSWSYLEASHLYFVSLEAKLLPDK